MKTKPLLRKIVFISLPSIIVFFLVLELSLRIGGYLYVRYRNPETYGNIAESSKDTLSILCLGDSFTYGLGASSEYSYPCQLEKMLNKGIERKVKVQNLGIPGGNSYRILNIFEEEISRHRPNIAIVMVGMNNSWNLRGMHRFYQRPFIDLRVYKLWGLIRTNLSKKISKISRADKERSITTNHQSRVSEEKWIDLKKKVKLYRKIGRGDLAIQELNAMLGKHPDEYALYGELVLFLREMGDHDLALTYAKKALEHSRLDSRDNSWLHLELVYIYRAKKDWQQARREMDHAVQETRAIYNVFPEMQNICNKESGLDFDIEINKLRKLINEIHGVKGTRIIDTLLHLKKNQKEKFETLRYDLLKLARIARKNDIRLILMTYPAMESSNGEIRNIAVRHAIKLIDNELIFDEKPNKETLFNLDRHCNGDGYEVLAGNVYSTLFKMGLLPEIK